MADPVYGNLFLNIGAMKAGTTWLFNVLRRHPKLKFGLEKEVHFLYETYVRQRMANSGLEYNHLRLTARAKRVRDTYLPSIRPQQDSAEVIKAKTDWIGHYLAETLDDAWYRDVFGPRNDAQFGCDFSNLSSSLTHAHWREIDSKSRKLRVLYIMRDPVERMWSHVKFQYRYNHEELARWTPREYQNFFARPEFAPHVEYGQIIGQLRRGLDPDQLKIWVYEDLHSDRLGHLRDLEDFLGIEPVSYPEDVLEKRHAMTPPMEMPDFFPELFSRKIDQVKRELQAHGLTVPGSWR